MEEVQTQKEVKYAGFWVRVLALIIDNMVLGIAIFLLALITGQDGFYFDNTNSPVHDILQIAIVLIYSASFESSKYMATPGKMALNLKVTGLNGERISFGKAVLRFIGEIFSAVLLCIGYIMVAFSKKKQALHDKMVGTLVIKE